MTVTKMKLVAARTEAVIPDRRIRIRRASSKRLFVSFHRSWPAIRFGDNNVPMTIAIGTIVFSFNTAIAGMSRSPGRMYSSMKNSSRPQ